MTNNLKIVGFAGSSSRPSRTRNLVEAIAGAAAKRSGAAVSLYDLTEIHPSLGSTLDPRQAPQDLQELIAEITAADALIADCAQFDSTDDRNLLAPDLFTPGLRKLGGFEGVAVISATNPLLLHNVGPKFTTSFIDRVYKGMHVPERFRQESAALSDDQIVSWIAQ